MVDEGRIEDLTNKIDYIVELAELYDRKKIEFEKRRQLWDNDG